MFKKFKSLSKLKKAAVYTVAAFVAIVAIGCTHTPPKTVNVQQVGSTSVLGDSTTQEKSQPKPQTVTPVITYQTTTETQPIPFTTATYTSSSLAVGQTKITTAGVNGVSTLTYKLTFTDGKQTNKELVSQVTTKAPVTQLSAVGTYVAPPVSYTPTPAPTPNSSCDPNYTGCVPNVYPSDVDCAGGSGNGPYYVSGPISVIGVDRYGLDADHDGIACE